MYVQVVGSFIWLCSTIFEMGWSHQHCQVGSLHRPYRQQMGHLHLQMWKTVELMRSFVDEDADHYKVAGRGITHKVINSIKHGDENQEQWWKKGGIMIIMLRFWRYIGRSYGFKIDHDLTKNTSMERWELDWVNFSSQCKARQGLCLKKWTCHSARFCTPD